MSYANLHFIRVVEINIGVICGSVPHLASLFRRHKLNLGAASSLRRLLFRKSRKSSRKSSDFVLDNYNRVNSNVSAPQNVRIETKVLGSMQGYASTCLTRCPSLISSEWKKQDVPLTCT